MLVIGFQATKECDKTDGRKLGVAEVDSCWPNPTASTSGGMERQLLPLPLPEAGW